MINPSLEALQEGLSVTLNLYFKQKDEISLCSSNLCCGTKCFHKFTHIAYRIPARKKKNSPLREIIASPEENLGKRGKN
jgi:hypothetical protein